MAMRLWFGSYVRRATMVLAGAWIVSVAVHSAIIGVALLNGNKAPGPPEDNLANHIFYIPPPDRAPPDLPPGERVRYVALAPHLFGLGLGASQAGAEKPVPHDQSPLPGNVLRDTTLAEAPQPKVRAPEDSVFTILEVDSAVVRSANSAAPAYPLTMLNKGISGSVMARYVVDTTGFADTTTFEVVRSTHPEFVKAVRGALPYMRFSPAKMGLRKVRQLVEQEFTFKINPPPKPGSDPQ
jgi:outer membrane biosynthesis protein TonB